MINSSRSTLFVCLIISLSWLVLSLPTWAQKDMGGIVGTVKDSSGAVVPSADVAVTDVERGETFKATTNDSGGFVASPLHRF